MCDKVICRVCSKATWSGCGEHIEEALVGVALSDRCAGHPKEIKPGGLLKRLFSNR